MPITTNTPVADRFSDPDHWLHVMETLLIPAVERAGYEAIRPSASGSMMIHANIINHLVNADMVLCDLSTHNPNVYFELGVRTALNLSISLVAEAGTVLPFDVGGINTAFYDPDLKGWQIADEVAAIAAHLSASADAADHGNPLWSAFGLKIRASLPADSGDRESDQLTLVVAEIEQLRSAIESNKNVQSQVEVTPGTHIGAWADTDSNELRSIRSLVAHSAQNATLRAFLNDVEVFSTEDGSRIEWFQLTGAPTVALAYERDLAAVPLASRRALNEAARQRELQILPLPTPDVDASATGGR